MSAKEMFEELGYELIQDDMNWLIYSVNGSKWWSFNIDFNKNDKTIHFCTRNSVFGHSIDLRELKAINQQCKELGWIK